MYLIHYVFAVWLQYALLGAGLFAVGKAAIVFGGTLIMSWAIAAAMAGAHAGLATEAANRIRQRMKAESDIGQKVIGAPDNMPLVFTLAFRNLFHDRLRFIATVIGIVFSIVLVTVQMGLYLGFGRMVTTMIDHASADLWIMPRGTKCFEDPSLLDTRERYRALAINGVAEAIPVVIGFADWRMPSGATTPVFVIGSDLRSGGLQPWNLVEGRIEALSNPEGRRGRPNLFRSAWHLGDRGDRRNPPATRAGGGRHQRHPFIHHDAVRFHGRRSGAGPHRGSIRQGHLSHYSPERRMPISITFAGS